MEFKIGDEVILKKEFKNSYLENFKKIKQEKYKDDEDILNLVKPKIIEDYGIIIGFESEHTVMVRFDDKLLIISIKHLEKVENNG